MLGSDDGDHVVIISNDPRRWMSRTRTPTGAAVELGKCRWGRRRGQRPSLGRHDDTYPVADWSFGIYIYLYLYLYLYPSVVFVRVDVVLLPILLFFAWGLFGRASVDFNGEERTRMTTRSPLPPPSPSLTCTPSRAFVVKASFAAPPILFLFSSMTMTGRSWSSSKSTLNINLLCCHAAVSACLHPHLIIGI